MRQILLYVVCHGGHVEQYGGGCVDEVMDALGARTKAAVKVAVSVNAFKRDALPQLLNEIPPN